MLGWGRTTDGGTRPGGLRGVEVGSFNISHKNQNLFVKLPCLVFCCTLLSFSHLEIIQELASKIHSVVVWMTFSMVSAYSSVSRF